MSKTRIAVVGSRNYPVRWPVLALIRRLHEHGPDRYVIVTGTAPKSTTGVRADEGIDEWAVFWARHYGLERVVHEARWDDLDAPGAVVAYRRDGIKCNKRAGVDRNRLIVQDCDHLVAFWDLQSRGTAHTLDMALAAGKVAKVYGPNVDEHDRSKGEIPFEQVGDAVRSVLRYR